MTATFTTTGTLTDGTKLTLDTPAPQGTGRVRVTVEPVAEPSALNLLDFFEELRKEQQARIQQELKKQEEMRRLAM